MYETESKSENIHECNKQTIYQMPNMTDSYTYLILIVSCMHLLLPGYLTIGIPTVHRQSAEYIHDTLDSIVNHTSDIDKEEVVVIILAADNDTNKRAKTIASLFDRYRHFFESGFFQVIATSQGLYPSFEKLDNTFNDKPERVAWRSKQNLDYSFMFAYSRNISEYFVMIEDDVVSAPGFVTDIRLAVAQQTKTYPEWYCIEFSHLGFIGKLFRSSDLKKNAIFFYLFFRYQPGDMLLPHLYNLNTQFKRIVIKPTLFQHMGYHSSLGNVRGAVKDKFFKKISKRKHE